MPDLIVMLSTGAIIGIVVAILVVLLIGLLVMMANKKKQQQLEADRARAQEMRQETVQSQSQLREAELEAEQRRAEAEQKRIEAERAELRQQEADRGVAQERAGQEDRLREADRIDPDVDHTADDYTPTDPATSSHDSRTGTAAAAGAGAGAAGAGAVASSHDTVFDDRTEGEPSDGSSTEGERPAAYGDGSVDDNVGYGDTYVDENGVLRNRDGSEHVRNDDTDDSHRA